MKSQVTVFIILAMTIIVVSTIFITSSNKKQLDILKQSDDVNLKQITPVKIYIEAAMQNLLLEGYFLIGEQGGKIYTSTWPDCLEINDTWRQEYRMCNQNGTFLYGYPDNYPKYLKQSPYIFKRINVGINSSRGDPGFGRITTSSFEQLEQPFAYPHIGKTRGKDYIYGFQQPLPPITSTAGEISIESQLALWMENHMIEMLNFTEFEKRGFDIIMQSGKPSVDVEINEKFMTAHMNYTVRVKKADIDYTIKEFYTQIHSDFRRTYNYINWVIREDISTKSHILRQKLFNETGQRIGGIGVIESNPKNFQYDVVNVTIWSIDYRKTYNMEDPNYHFYFIRENRASDAGTVKIVPAYFYPGDTATWFCFNMKTAESPFDPDEDDDWSQDPFPWTNPPWYVWYSRGDQLVTKHIPTEECNGISGGPVTTNKVLVPIRDYHIDPHSTRWGASFMDILPNCGNADDDVSTTATNDDVGDLIILITQDQQTFSPGGEVLAPSRYPDPPILEDGRGRLNDAISYRPVKCNPGDGDPGCCVGGYWNFDKRPVPESLGLIGELCTSACTWEDGPRCKKNCKCSHYETFYYLCDHTGHYTWDDKTENPRDDPCPTAPCYPP
ncbi:MAG: hypothetical protein ABIJ34_00520 [archaeon]